MTDNQLYAVTIVTDQPDNTVVRYPMYASTIREALYCVELGGHAVIAIEQNDDRQEFKVTVEGAIRGHHALT